MPYCLDGDHIEISNRSLKTIIGKRVQYLRGADIDKSGRGYFFPRSGRIEKVFGWQIQIDNEYHLISSLKEVVVLDD